MKLSDLISFLLLLLSSCYAAIPDDRWKRQLFNEQIPKVRPLTGYLQQMHHKKRFNDSAPTAHHPTTSAPTVDIPTGEVELFGHPNNNNHNNNNNNSPYDKNLNNKNNISNSILHFNTINSYTKKPLHISKYKYQYDDLSKLFDWHRGNQALNYPFSYSWSYRE